MSLLAFLPRSFNQTGLEGNWDLGSCDLGSVLPWDRWQSFPQQILHRAVPGALVNEELVLHRAERGISSGFAPFLHLKRDPEHARGASLPGESPQLPRGRGCGWRSILALWARCWDLAGTGNTL